MKLRKILSRIGGVIVEPHREIELMVVEGVDAREGFIVSLLSLIALLFASILISSITSIVTSITNFIAFIVLGLIAYYLYLFAFYKIITVLYKAPGYFKEFFGVSSYSLVSSLLPLAFGILFSIVHGIDSSFYMIIGIAVGFGWLFWFNAILYISAKIYFKIDFVQFLVAVIISWIALFVIIIVATAIYSGFFTLLSMYVW